MITFALPGLHPSYERPVRDVLRGLEANYPLGYDLRVEFEDAQGDHSLACSSERGVILLNAYWFRRTVNDLRAAAESLDNFVCIKPGAPIGFHGMFEEPTHVLTHEYAHQIQQVVPWAEFAELHWQGACADPVHRRPPSGYALASPDEYFADCFAAMRLGYESNAGEALREFLASKGLWH